jgi:hypothetical protein
MMFAAEAAAGYAVDSGVGALVGDDRKKKNGLAAELAKQTGFSVLSTVPLLGAPAANAIQGYGSDTNLIENAVGSLAKPSMRALEGKAGDRIFWRQVADGLGSWTGFPPTAWERSFEAIVDRAHGQDVRPAEYVFGRRRQR